MSSQDLLTHSSVILDSLGDGVYVCDRERRIVHWSTSAERITGWTREDVVGRRCLDNILCHIDKDGHRLCGKEFCPLHRSMVTGTASNVPLIVFAKTKDGGTQGHAMRYLTAGILLSKMRSLLSGGSFEGMLLQRRCCYDCGALGRSGQALNVCRSSCKGCIVRAIGAATSVPVASRRRTGRDCALGLVA